MRNCIVCGKEYTIRGRRCGSCVSREWKQKNPERWKAMQKRQNAKYRAKHRKPDTKGVCKLCKKIFTTARQTPYQKFCSYKCQALQWKIDNREKVAGWKRLNRERRKDYYSNYNHEYKDKIRFSGNREKVLERDAYTCRDCGKTRPRLHIHHKDESGSTPNPNNKMSNLITLCASCHKRRHLH